MLISSEPLVIHSKRKGGEPVAGTVREGAGHGTHCSLKWHFRDLGLEGASWFSPGPGVITAVSVLSGEVSEVRVLWLADVAASLGQAFKPTSLKSKFSQRRTQASVLFTAGFYPCLFSPPLSHPAVTNEPGPGRWSKDSEARPPPWPPPQPGLCDLLQRDCHAFGKSSHAPGSPVKHQLID